MRAMRPPRKRAGDDHGVERMVPEVAAVLLLTLPLLLLGQLIPALAGRERVKNLVQAPRLPQPAGELAVRDLEAGRGLVALLDGRVASVFAHPAELDQRNVPDDARDVGRVL